MYSLFQEVGSEVAILFKLVANDQPSSSWGWVVWSLLGHISEHALLSPQEHFPSREEKLYPGWVQVVCVLLSFLPSLWVPAVALAHLLCQHRRRWRDAHLESGLKPQESRGC